MNPRNDWTSFLFVWVGHSDTLATFAGSILTELWEITTPRYSTEVFSNLHFSSLRDKLCCWRAWWNTLRLAAYWWACWCVQLVLILVIIISLNYLVEFEVLLNNCRGLNDKEWFAFVEKTSVVGRVLGVTETII